MTSYKDLKASMETPEWTLRRMSQDEIETLKLIDSEGMKSYGWFSQPKNQKYRLALRKCKARGLVLPIRRKTAYWYSLTDFGLRVLLQLGMPLSSQLPSS